MEDCSGAGGAGVVGRRVGGVSGATSVLSIRMDYALPFSVPEREYSIQRQLKTGINSGRTLQDLNILLKADSFY